MKASGFFLKEYNKENKITHRQKNFDDYTQ